MKQMENRKRASKRMRIEIMFCYVLDVFHFILYVRELNALNTFEHDTANKARQSNKKDVKIFRKFMLHKFHIG